MEEPTIRITNILLAELTFKRAPSVNFHGSKKPEMKIDVSCNVDADKLTVIEKVTYKQIDVDTNTEDLIIDTTMIGQFQKYGDIDTDLEKFGKINGAAIIFPFIREQISQLSLRASLPQILLPPVNFVKFNEISSE